VQEDTGRKYVNKVKPQRSKKEYGYVAVDKKRLPEAVEKGFSIPLSVCGCFFFGGGVMRSSVQGLALEYKIRVGQDL
jgi:hypothetical protein